MAKRITPIWSGTERPDGNQYYRSPAHEPIPTPEPARRVSRREERTRVLGCMVMFLPALVLTILDITGVWQIGTLWALTTLWLPTGIYTGAATITALFRAILAEK